MAQNNMPEEQNCKKACEVSDLTNIENTNATPQQGEQVENNQMTAVKAEMSIFPPGHYKNVKDNDGVMEQKAVMECHPCQISTPLSYVYKYIRGSYAMEVTEKIRMEEDKKKQNLMKLLELMYCTPYGTFSYRNAKRLIKKSGLMVVDIDDILDEFLLKKLRYDLERDNRYVTALLFISPRGHGLKWFIEVDEPDIPLADFMRKVARYVQYQYGVVIDPSGKDACRPCYLSYDPECYINPKYLING